jgi:hypothetical protein
MTTRRSPGTKSRAASTPPDVTPSLTPADELADELRRIKGDDGDLFTLLLNDKYRLAVKCDVCGRWLTSHTSKVAGRGPSCAARSVTR